MWLAPFLSQVANAALRVYYRLHRAGAEVPRTGPVLLVANHPNSLLDPAMVALAARRPVRFLAKAPLFKDPLVGFLVRGAGSIPVYRKSDDPSQVGRNEEMFRAVHQALANGAAVGIFPEGLSHSDPSLAPLKTGAARIALGTLAGHGIRVPIIPIGSVFRNKNVFRSEALVTVGRPVAWDDLSPDAEGDGHAVRDLTQRIDQALRDVTVNLERWEDAALVELAEAIYAAEFGKAADAADWVSRLRMTTETLSHLRQAGDGSVPLAKDITRHGRVLQRLGVRPQDLVEDPKRPGAVWWLLRRLPLGGAIPLIVLAVGTLVFAIPYRLTGIVEKRARPRDDVRATHKLLAGAIVFPLWILILSLGLGAIAGPLAGLAALVALPALGLFTLGLHEQWREAGEEARRYVTVKRRRDRIEPLRDQQRELAVRLKAVLEQQSAQVPQPRSRPHASALPHREQ
ncbi:MAG TPA: lysophospholipid acyltransferase family protein [Gemmatimonadaceae bacterium]|nr:lysophospholipid acyltransferase family protein [Gemmatimonadaceae bacterium]